MDVSAALVPIVNLVLSQIGGPSPLVAGPRRGVLVGN